MSDEAKRIVAEETWVCVDAGHDPIYVELSDGRRKESTEEQDRIMACAPEALRLLMRIEHVGDEYPRCPVCFCADHRDHDADCALDVLLKKAGLR